METAVGTPEAVPLVDYLVLSEHPHLVANECVACGARYFDRRNACAACGASNFGSAEGSAFKRVDISTTGELRAFTIVAFAAPGIPVPFVAGVVDCDGTSVKANVVNIEPDADHVAAGLKVQLTTFEIGEDSEGTPAVGFGFEPVDPAIRKSPEPDSAGSAENNRDGDKS